MGGADSAEGGTSLLWGSPAGSLSLAGAWGPTALLVALGSSMGDTSCAVESVYCLYVF